MSKTSTGCWLAKVSKVENVFEASEKRKPPTDYNTASECSTEECLPVAMVEGTIHLSA